MVVSTEDSGAAIGVTGLAVVGPNLARNLARHGYAVAVHNGSS
jgi:6-phosphogluconate dehydrogenase